MRKAAIFLIASLVLLAGGAARAEETPAGGGTTKPEPVATGAPEPAPDAGQRLYIEDVQFEGGDADGVPEPGESLRAFLVLRNEGRDAATSVRARVKVTGEGVTSSTDEIAWPDVAPGASEKSATAIAVKIAENAPRQDACPGMARDDGTKEIPADQTGTVSSDTPVSSDGSTGSSGNASSEPGSAPGSTGAGSSGSTGIEPAVVDPAPPTTATIEPVPAPGTIEPAPEPAPEGDRPVLVQIQLDLTADGYTSGAEYSNGVVCALAEGGLGAPAVDDRSKTSLAAREAAAKDGSNAALPVGVLVVVSAAAVMLRRSLIG